MSYAVGYVVEIKAADGAVLRFCDIRRAAEELVAAVAAKGYRAVYWEL